MFILKKECIPGSTIFYIADGIPHTAIVKSNVHKDYYEIEDKRFLSEYEDDFGFVLKKVCTHTNEIWLPKYPNEMETKYFIEIARGHSVDNFPKRALYRKDVTEYRPFIEFEEGMIFKLRGDNTYYYYRNGILPTLIDIYDSTHAKIPLWRDQDSGIVACTAEISNIINEDDVVEIYSFNSYMGDPSYKNINSPISKFYNLLYKR